MMVEYIDVDRVREVTLYNIEIVLGEDAGDDVEIYMLNSDGQRIEGGTFNKAAFMNCVLEFYNKNY